VIRIEGIQKQYGRGDNAVHVLHDVSLRIETGELVSIMGSSGSGKSTLLNILGILDDYDGGHYYLDDRLIRDLSEREAAHYRNRRSRRARYRRC
jgi:putative ABC transport system ATP-binding protein